MAPSTVSLAIGIAAALASVAAWMAVSQDRSELPEVPVSAPAGGRIHPEPQGAPGREPLVARELEPGPYSSREGWSLGRGRVDLRVVDGKIGMPIRAFSWSFTSGFSGGQAEGGESVAARARLAVPLEVTVAVTVTADGYDASLPVDVSLADGNLYRSVEVRLVPAFTGPAIALSVHDEVGQSVPWLRISCAVPDEEGGGNSYRTSWTRTSTAADGLHEVSGLEPGRYRLRMAALNEEGHPLAHSFQERVVWFDGVRRTEVSVVMSTRRDP